MTRRRSPAEGRLVVYFDGASRGNPGPASFGVASPSGIEISESIGPATNNVAEWRGFLAALDVALASRADDVEIRADSELVLKQFLGTYRMRAPHLAPFLEEARRKASRIPHLRVVHVPRAENREADALANRALDAGRRVASRTAPSRSPAPDADVPAANITRSRRAPRRPWQPALFGTKPAR